MAIQRNEVILEPVAESDFESLAALRIEAMRESLEQLGRFDPERARERLRAGFEPRSPNRCACPCDASANETPFPRSPRLKPIPLRRY